jgi:hypothetical protein
MLPTPTSGGVPVVPGRHCAVFAVDIAGFGNLERDDQVRLHMRDTLYSVLAAAFNAAGVPWAETYREDRGDGVLVLVNGSLPHAALIDPLLDLLLRALRKYNRTAAEMARIRLRAALHAGQVYNDAHGLAGTAVNHAFRLLEAEEFKRTLSTTDAELAFITSDTLYDDVVRHGRPGLIDPDGFAEVTVHTKETEARAWIHLPGMGPPRAWSATITTRTNPGHPGRTDTPRLVFNGETHIHGDVVAGDKHVHAPGDAPEPAGELPSGGETDDGPRT